MEPVKGACLPRPGDTIAGKYVLERLLGQGGMGAVFAANHAQLARQVAIKLMLASVSDSEAAQRFVNEARAVANIQNEHVVHVFDIGEENGFAYMVLELLEGDDLGQLLVRQPGGRFPPDVAVGYVLQALTGVMAAHAIAIVHRDLKPSNLFLARRKDGSSVVKVLDFGISKVQGSSVLAASPSALTSTKAMLGSPLYIAPEQLRKSKDVDTRADVWAVGAILYELVTGQPPFMRDNLGELFVAILEETPAPLRAHVADVSPALDQIVLRCLERRREDRFQTIAELAQALRAAVPGAEAAAGTRPAGGAILPSPALTSGGMQRTDSGWQKSGPAPLPRHPRSNAVPVGVTLALGALLVMGAAVAVVGPRLWRSSASFPAAASGALASARVPAGSASISEPAIDVTPAPVPDASAVASSATTGPSSAVTAAPDRAPAKPAHVGSSSATVAASEPSPAKPTKPAKHAQAAPPSSVPDPGPNKPAGRAPDARPVPSGKSSMPDLSPTR